MRHAFLLLAPALALAACGSSSDPAEQQADRLENAAQQSTPEAAAVLDNAADSIRDQGASGAPGDPNSSVQQAMEQAGAAQAGNSNVPTAPTPAPPSQQAAPHGSEEGNPPATVDTKR